MGTEKLGATDGTEFTTAQVVICPLCCAPETEFFYHDPIPTKGRRRSLRQKNPREYRCCPNCDLVFVTSRYLLDPATEKRIYDAHENSPTDQGYRRFLGRIFEPVLERLAPGAAGLDFGCGPGPTLSVMFAERGFAMEVYDPYYAPDTKVLQRSYPFITSTEVLEHLHAPHQTLAQLWGLVAPGGFLALMTSMRPAKADFSAWRYKNDPTHVCFYSIQTMSWLAHQWSAELEFVAHDAMIFTRSTSTPALHHTLTYEG